MKDNKTNKRFSVEVNGLLIGAFETFEEAYDFINYSRWVGLASIYDHEEQRETEAYIII